MQFDPSHISEIIAYYRTNYTNCPEDTNFFASWHFLSGFLHSVFIVQSPLVIFTGYCILKKTPQVMGSLKWAMLNVHFWSTYMDVLLCTLTIPYLIFPAIGGFPLGLLRWLGVVITNFYSQSVNNVGAAFVSLHGLASMITTLAIHHPYRSYIRSFFKTSNISPPPIPLSITNN